MFKLEVLIFSLSGSSIVWGGFKRVFYLFPYAITSDQGIPHDIDTMHELWGVNSYRKQNKYISTACVMDMIDGLGDSTEKSELLKRKEKLVSIYMDLANKYHEEKVANSNNSLVLG